MRILGLSLPHQRRDAACKMRHVHTETLFPMGVPSFTGGEETAEGLWLIDLGTPKHTPAQYKGLK